MKYAINEMCTWLQIDGLLRILHSLDVLAHVRVCRRPQVERVRKVVRDERLWDLQHLLLVDEARDSIRVALHV